MVMVLVPLLRMVLFSSFVITVSFPWNTTSLKVCSNAPNVKIKCYRHTLNRVMSYSDCRHAIAVFLKGHQAQAYILTHGYTLATLDVLCPIIVPWNICIFQLD